MRRANPQPMAPAKSRRWSFMSRFDIADLDRPTETYLTRWRLVQVPWFGIYLHAIRKPDGSRDLHDHPWSFLSLVLRGGYVEERNGWMTERRAGSLALRRTSDVHRVQTLTRTPTWTLLLVGPRTHEWGFYVDGKFVPNGEWIAENFPQVAS